MIKIITDSTAYIPQDYVLQNDIAVIPLTVNINGTEYVEGYPGTFDEIFNAADIAKVIPKTSLPSTSAFVDAYEKVIKSGNEALVFTISSSLSGTYNNAVLAKTQCSKPAAVEVIDSGTCGQVVWGFVMEAIADIKAGKNITQIITHIAALQTNSEMVFCPEGLEHLRRGGRISLISTVLGNILKIRPILSFKDGKLTCAKRLLGNTHSLGWMINRIPKQAKIIIALRIQKSEQYDKLKELISFAFPNISLIDGEIGPVIGAHVGTAYGVAWISD